MRLLCVGQPVPEEVLSGFKSAGRLFHWELLEDWKALKGDFDAILINERSYRLSKFHFQWALSKCSALVVLHHVQDDAVDTDPSGAARLWQEIKKEYRTTEVESLGLVHLHWGKIIQNDEIKKGYPCKHRSVEAVREVGCKPCATITGLKTVSVHFCYLHDCECALGSNELEGQGAVSKRTQQRLTTVKGCTVCPDRQPSELVELTSVTRADTIHPEGSPPGAKP